MYQHFSGVLTLLYDFGLNWPSKCSVITVKLIYLQKWNRLVNICEKNSFKHRSRIVLITCIFLNLKQSSHSSVLSLHLTSTISLSYWTLWLILFTDSHGSTWILSVSLDVHLNADSLASYINTWSQYVSSVWPWCFLFLPDFVFVVVSCCIRCKPFLIIHSLPEMSLV